jgi:hypothetical protein
VYNSTFYCDGTATYCYSLVKAPASFAQAAANCTAMNGWLVKYDTPLQQFDVESYLNASGALTPYYYWIGIRRASINDSYTYVQDNSSMPQAASNSPYAHWSWRQAVAATQRGFDCVIAQRQFAYDIYMGDATPKQLASVDYYAVNDSIYVALKYGWNAQACNANHAYVCQVPTALFPCYPPPSPTPPPPSPPPPPRPPTPPSGERSTLGSSAPLRLWRATSLRVHVHRRLCSGGRGCQSSIPAPGRPLPLPWPQARRPPTAPSSASTPASSATATASWSGASATRPPTAPCAAASWWSTSRRRSSAWWRPTLATGPRCPETTGTA